MERERDKGLTVREFFRRYRDHNADWVQINDAGWGILAHKGGLTVLSPRSSAKEFGYRDDSYLTVAEACGPVAQEKGEE